MVQYMVANKGTVYIKTESQKEAAQKEVAEVINEFDKLGKLIDKTNSVIYEISSTFPFQLFPDKLIIDENKVTIVRKELFFKRVFPIMYEDLITVKVNRSFIFAAMEFEIKRISKRPRPVSFLNPREATLAKKYIMGLIEAKNAKIDLSKLSTPQIREKLEEIGKAGDEAETLF